MYVASVRELGKMGKHLLRPLLKPPKNYGKKFSRQYINRGSDFLYGMIEDNMACPCLDEDALPTAVLNTFIVIIDTAIYM